MAPPSCMALSGSRRLSMHRSAQARKPLPSCLLFQASQIYRNHAHEGDPAWLGRPLASTIECTTRAASGAACGADATQSATDGTNKCRSSSSGSSGSSSTGYSSSINCSSDGSNSSGRAAVVRGQSGPTTAAAALGPLSSTAPGATCLVEDTTPDNWRMPLRRPGSVVALGKFDALHRGHCALATAAAALAQDIHAARCSNVAAVSAGGNDAAAAPSPADDGPGDAVLLSFSGMAAVLGWPNRLPLTAPQDRGRVLAGWATGCGGSQVQQQQQRSSSGAPFGLGHDSRAASDSGTGTAVEAPPPRLRTMPFSLIRGMSPEQFVALLARDLGAAGVVAGRNYRFGYKAAGDADALVTMGNQYGMCVKIVDLVMLPNAAAASGSVGTSSDVRNGDSLAPALEPAGAAWQSSLQSSSAVAAPAVSRRGEDSDTASAGMASEAPAAFAVASTLDGSFTSVDGADGATEAGPGGNGGGAAIRAAGGGSGGGAAGASSRVSSSRIRALLERGEVESVEQLLGRKYRLVCDMADATLLCSSTKGLVQDDSQSSCFCSGEDEVGTSAEVWLAVPSGAYQNQPPANGQYRALVQVVTSNQVAINVEGSPSDGTAAVANAAVLVSGGACLTVELNDKGLQVDLNGSNIQGGIDAYTQGLLLVDFDVCG